jgi:CubicO group peptidase (beta-lactamase class C family)
MLKPRLLNVLIATGAVSSTIMLTPLAFADACTDACNQERDECIKSAHSGPERGQCVQARKACLTECKPVKHNPEAKCEANVIASWQSSMPSLGFAGRQAAQAIDQAVQKQLDHAWMSHPQFVGGRWPGLSVAITAGSKLVFAKSYGFADMASPQITHPDHLFRLASDSKQITGAAILKLIADGQSVDGNPANKLTLQSKIFPILSSSPNAILPTGGAASINPAIMNITVEQVLHHTAGWAYNIGDPVWYAFNVPNPLLPVTEDNVVETMMTQAPSLSPPGQTFSYSNFGYNLLATLITKITGKDYETVVKEQVLHPIGITRTRVGHSLLSGRADGEVRYYAYAGTPSARSMFPAATGPTISGDDNIPYGTWSLEAGRGAGGWIASAMDVLRFQIGVNGRNPAAQVYPGIASDILSNVDQPSQQLCVQNCSSLTSPINPATDRYNAGWGVHWWAAPYNGFELDHGGGVNGGGSFTEAIPDAPNVKGYGLAFLINSSPQPTLPPGDSFDLSSGVRDTMLKVLAANGGSLLNPSSSADTDFFDQYGDFSAYVDAATLNAMVSSGLHGCTYKGHSYSTCYASRLEGRASGAINSYRLQMVPLHSGDKEQHVLGATCSSYVKKNTSMKAAGYQQVNLQSFRDASQMMRFQSVWVQLNH